MDAVIRGAQVHSEPVLLATERAPAPPSGPKPLLRPAVAGGGAAPARPEATGAATLEARLRRQLEAESQAAVQQAVQEAREVGIEQGLEQGMEQGLEQGRKDGAEQGRADWAERIAALDALLASINQSLHAGIAGSEDLMIEIAFEAVGKILGPALATREGVAAMVRQSLAALHEREGLVIRLAPRDLALLQGMRAEMTRWAGTKALEIVADERIDLGGCLIETTGGGLDGRLETQLLRLRDALVLARAPTGSAS